MADALTLGSLVAFLQHSQRFFRPISDMSEKFNGLQGAMASAERVFELLDTPVHVTSPRHAVASPATGRPQTPAGPGAIAFEHVSFAYVEGEPVLRTCRSASSPGSASPSSARRGLERRQS